MSADAQRLEVDVNVIPPEHRDAADMRFRQLVGSKAWSELPDAVRKRFSKRLAPGEVKIYSGHVVKTELTWIGKIIALAAMLIGSPLPSSANATGPSVVVVEEDAKLGGQSWTRTYARPGRFPQVVHSAKRFRGPTGLEEYVGGGIGMTLRVTVENEALVFRSERYFIEIARRRMYLPAALSPGKMAIVHTQENANEFSFRLTLTHALFGDVLHQLAFFREV